MIETWRARPAFALRAAARSVVCQPKLAGKLARVKAGAPGPPPQLRRFGALQASTRDL
jgi:hypothetical protein